MTFHVFDNRHAPFTHAVIRQYSLIHGKRLARVAPISDSVIGGMFASKCAITRANRTYIIGFTS